MINKQQKQSNMNLQDLKKQLPHKWKVQNFTGNKANCVAYIDSRQVQDLLDDVVGPENWSDDYEYDTNGNLQCKLSIFIDGRTVTKIDVGVESSFEKAKGLYSDAFKRAAVKWGVGRFLYSLKAVTIPAKEYNGKKYPADFSGSILWDKSSLMEFINDNFTPVPIDVIKKKLTTIKTEQALNKYFLMLPQCTKEDADVIALFKTKKTKLK